MSSAIHGVLVVDKPSGCTSHDVVAKARRALSTRKIGHAGTLDPMATGVLVLAVGEATKLVGHLTADDKCYEAVVRLGTSTHSLDADGDIVDEKPVPALDLAKIKREAAHFIGTIRQRVPKVSAIKVDGVALHRRVRRGEEVAPPEREVHVRSLSIDWFRDGEIGFTVEASKGFYVRSLGRDLAEALGTLGHLTALRRTRSGHFSLEGAVSLKELSDIGSDEPLPDSILARVIPPEKALGSMKTFSLNAEGIVDAGHGRTISADRVVGGSLAGTQDEPVLDSQIVALLGEGGTLVALARHDGDFLSIVRGFRF
jgi:tRNA pseudouridine55 synthase